MSNAREIVVKMLTKTEKNNSYSNILLSDTLKKYDLSTQDKKFASALFYGVLERKLTLDGIITDNSANSSKKLSDDVRNIIRTGLYQILYMDSVPDNAAVDESVKLAKKNKNPAVSGFVNALLREFLRKGKKLPGGKDRIDKLCIEYSCPKWLIRKWMSEYGEDVCMQMLETSLGKAPDTVRINTVGRTAEDVLKILSDEGISFERSSLIPQAADLYYSGSVEATKAYKMGLIHVQDIASQLCVAALDPMEGDIVADLCAAPGGKSFTIAEKMNNTGKVYSCDLHDNRVNLIRAGAQRLGLSCVIPMKNDAKLFSQDIPAADRVLCDVPCSGLGVIRRKPEIKYKDPREFQRLPQIQYDILKMSCKYVKAGGILVYSTCTLSRDENDRVVDRFLRENPDFESCPLGEIFGDDKNRTRITLTPGKYNSDGFFVAKLKRIR